MSLVWYHINIHLKHVGTIFRRPSNAGNSAYMSFQRKRGPNVSKITPKWVQNMRFNLIYIYIYNVETILTESAKNRRIWKSQQGLVIYMPTSEFFPLGAKSNSQLRKKFSCLFAQPLQPWKKCPILQRKLLTTPKKHDRTSSSAMSLLVLTVA